MKKNKLKARFLDKILIGLPNGCWEWNKPSINGYGIFIMKNPRKVWKAHRIAWILFKGNIPDGLNVLHECDNRRCVNPGHLFLGTQKDNVHDMWIKGRQHKNVLENHGCTKINRDIVKRIRQKYTGRHGELTKLSKEFELKIDHIFKIVTHKIWRHI